MQKTMVMKRMDTQANCPKEYLPATNNEDITFSLGFTFSGPTFKVIKVTKEHLDSYHYTITSVKELRYSLNIDRV